MYIPTRAHYELAIAIAGSVVASCTDVVLIVAASVIGGTTEETLRSIGGGSLIAFWAGIMLGWKLRASVIKKRDKDGTKPD